MKTILSWLKSLIFAWRRSPRQKLIAGILPLATEVAEAFVNFDLNSDGHVRAKDELVGLIVQVPLGWVTEAFVDVDGAVRATLIDALPVKSLKKWLTVLQLALKLIGQNKPVPGYSVLDTALQLAYESLPGSK